ncbi:unnamed protein product, partial [Rotaria sp. Silwood1]
MWRGSG